MEMDDESGVHSVGHNSVRSIGKASTLLERARAGIKFGCYPFTPELADELTAHGDSVVHVVDGLIVKVVDPRGAGFL